MSLHAFHGACLIVLAFLAAVPSCGGTIAGPQVLGDKDAGITGADDASTGDDSATADDSGVAPPDDCPTDAEVLTLGGACAFTGTCTTSLAICEGTTVSAACVCTNGVVELASGQMATCGADDSSTTPASGGCSLGAFCDEGDDGTTCTNVGAGPCDSDQQLLCQNGAYVADGFPCTGDVPSCGFGQNGGCSESCTCTNGEMVCTGDCPDAGPSMP